MRLLADEQRMGTLELLLTSPVRDAELVVGKFLGAFLFMLSLIALTWVFPIILNFLVSPGIDQGPLVSGYLGLILLVAVFIAIGVAISSLFTNPIPAFFATLGALLILWMIGFPAQAGGATGTTLLSYLDLSEHYYNSFYAGVIELKDIVYYLKRDCFCPDAGNNFSGNTEVEIMKPSWQRFAPIGLYLASISAVAALGLYIVQKQFNLYLQIALGLIVVGLALYGLLNPAGCVRRLLGARQRYGSNLLVLSLAFLGILVVINFVSNKNLKRWDLTEDRQHTLSPETISMLEKLPEKVNAMAFFQAGSSLTGNSEFAGEL